MATVEWQTTCTDIKQRGALLLETEEWTDCKLLVGPDAVPFRAHKLMLAMASSVFESMFFTDGAEAVEQDTFSIPDVKPKAFKALINYIYTENISINSYKRAHRLYLAANKYLIPQLARVCAEYMCWNVSMETACATHDAGFLYQDQTLMYESLQIIKPHIKEILHHKSFEEAEIDTVAAIFGIPNIKVEEIELFQALENYAKAHSSRKRSISAGPNETGQDTISCHSMRKALKNIRFLTFSLKEFATGPAQSGLLSHAEALALMINIAGGEAPMPPGFTDSRQRRYVRQETPEPVLVTTRGTVVATVTSAHADRRSFASSRVLIGTRLWTLTVLPCVETCTNNQTSTHLAVFVKCEEPTATAGWSCTARVVIALVNRNRTTSNKTAVLENTFSSSQNEWGEKNFIHLYEAVDTTRGYVRDGALTFEAQVTILNDAGGASSSA